MQVLLTPQEIQTRIEFLGKEISTHYQGEPLTIIGVMTGSLIFLADLIRAIDIPHRIAVVRASSYRGQATTSGQLEIQLDPVPDLVNRHVLVVDDIFDTGKTMVGITDALKCYPSLSIRTAVLLWKPARTVVALKPDYCGFEIEDHFVIGYGLDYNDDFRHLPYIGIYSE